MEKLEVSRHCRQGGLPCYPGVREAGVDSRVQRFFWLAMHKMPLSAGGDRHGWRQLPRDIQGALDVGIDGVWLNWTDEAETGR